VKSHFELSPAEYERKRQGHLHRRRIEIVSRDVDAHARRGDLVLEIGCGPGDVLAAVAATRPDVEFLGVDVDEAMVEHARSAHRAANVAFELVDLSATPLHRHARVAFAIDVLHHVHDLPGLVRAVREVVRPDGTWTVIEPNSRNPYIWLHQERMRRAGLDEHHFRPKAFERELAHSGLRVVSRSTAFVIPGAVRSVPRAVARLEQAVEGVSVLGGSVVYRVGSV
jgi:trans-aconitate methyltransferase